MCSTIIMCSNLQTYFCCCTGQCCTKTRKDTIHDTWGVHVMIISCCSRKNMQCTRKIRGCQYCQYILCMCNTLSLYPCGCEQVPFLRKHGNCNNIKIQHNKLITLRNMLHVAFLQQCTQYIMSSHEVIPNIKIKDTTLLCVGYMGSPTPGITSTFPIAYMAQYLHKTIKTTGSHVELL